MERYKVFIDCVDGETIYMMGCSDATRLLKFLKEYDHEGSTVSVEFWRGATEKDIHLVAEFYDDSAYEFLAGGINNVV